MTLYADILLLVNFIMNSLILWITGKIIRERGTALPRIFAGGLSMALLHGILLYTNASWIHPLAASVLILSLGVFIALRPSRPRKFFTAMLLAYITSFTVGGLGMGLFYLTDLPYALHILSRDMTGLAGRLPWYLPVICVLAAYLMIKLCLLIWERLLVKRQILCPVRVFLNGDEACFDALIDTGHSLKEPVSQSPVIIAEFEKVKIFLPDTMKLLFFEKQENELHALLHKQTDVFYSRLRIIPFTSLGRANGLLIGFRPDGVTVDGRLPPSEVVIGVYNSQLTRDGRYQGLLSPELMAG
jgi:stage II sporulation protein GA (sporulation sigma-E factor processing peptidase)